MMHFPLCFRFPPLFSKKFQTPLKIFQILPFPENFVDFRPPKFLLTFFSHQISSFPCFGTLSPCFAKIIIPPPYFQKFPSVFPKFTSFLHTFCVFRFPLL